MRDKDREIENPFRNGLSEPERSTKTKQQQKKYRFTIYF